MISYYILRSDLTNYYVNDVIERLQTGPDQRGWDVGVLTSTYRSPIEWTILKEIEATLHCLKSVQEASPIEDNADLRRLLSSEVLGIFPKTGSTRVRRTTVVLIGNSIDYLVPLILMSLGAYASWFTTQPQSAANNPSPLMNSIQYVVEALSEPSLCLPAANALRGLCDANRTALAPHLHAFGALHASLANIPVRNQPTLFPFVDS